MISDEKNRRLAGYSGLWALSICRPGATLVMTGVRAVTCRWFPAPPELIGRRIAIHARYHWSADVADIARRNTGNVWTPDDCPCGILGTVLLRQCATVDTLPEIINDPWNRPFRYKWMTTDPQPWPAPVFHKGKLARVWPVPPELIPPPTDPGRLP